MNILEIEAEGLPRYVGPFSFRFQAEDWAKEHVRNGSWSVISPTHPHQVEVNTEPSIGATEWGTDWWGDIESEPTEGHARAMVAGSRAKLFKRPPMGQWELVPS